MFNQQSVSFITYFLKAYPRRTMLMIGLLIFSGLAEGGGIMMLLPLLELTTSTGASGDSVLTRVVVRFFDLFGLEPTLGILLSLIVVAMALKGVLLWLAMRQVGYTVAQIATDLRIRLIRVLMNAQWSYFTSQPTGHFANAISSEAHRASSAYKQTCSALASVIQVAIYLIAIFLVSWQVALLAFVVCGGLVFVLQGFINMSRRAGRQQTSMMKSLVARLAELLPNIKPVKAMGREKNLSAFLEKETEGYNEAQRRAVLALETLTSFREPVIVLVMALGLYGMLTYGSVAFSTVLLLVVLSYRLITAVGALQSKYQQMTLDESAFWSLQGHIKRTEEARESSLGQQKPPSLEKLIQLDSVSFSYDGDKVLTDVSLTIPAGNFVTIIGPSGAGKTTLVDLLSGLLHPEQGEVFVDGMPLSQLDLASWRGMIGYVPQELLLFHDTICRNVTFGGEDISRQEVEDALKAAGAWAFVTGFADGMDKIVGERGTKLSAGQGQRIMIARALVKKPRLLILDEATAALDPEIEAAICETLKRLRGELTIVAISHQPAMRAAADVVYEVSGHSVRQ